MKKVITPTRKIKPGEWLPFEPTDAYALRAVQAGTAEPHQQQRALEWILRATRLRDETFVADKPDVSAYLAGMRAVGLQIVACMNWKSKQGE